MKKIGVSEILELDTKCTSHYGALFNKFRDDEKFYELAFSDMLDIPVEYKGEAIVLPTGRDVVDTFVDHIDLSNARVSVNKKGIYKTSDEEAEMMRKLFLGILYRTNLEADISPWRVAGKHFAEHGLAVIRDVWEPDLWPSKPKQDEGESENDYAERMDEWRNATHLSLPIDIQAVNPACVMPDPSYNRRGFVIEKHSRLCLDIMKKYPKWGNPQSKGVADEVEVLFYWDKTHRTMLVDKEPVLNVRSGVVTHDYGFIPYVFIESGLGNLSIDAKPDMRYVGLLRYIMDMLVAESRDYSLADIVLKNTAMPWGVITGENAKGVTEISKKFGTYTPLPEGVELEDKVPQTPPDALNLHMARTSDYIAAHAAPRSVRGLGESGVRSGADRRLVLAEAGARYQYSKDAFKYGVAKVLVNCAKLLKNVIPGDVRVWALTPNDEFDVVVKKDKLREPFTCYVEFAPISEEDEYRRHDDLERLTKSGIVTVPWARKQLPNIDPLAMELEEEKEKIKNDPNLQMMVAQYAQGKLAAAIGKRGEAEGLGGETQMPMEGMGMGEPGRRMSPPIPQRAPLGSMGELENRWKGIRSPVSMTQQGMGGGGNR